MVKAFELAYCRVQVPNLDEAERFYTSFGLLTRTRENGRLFMRGHGPEHYLIEAQEGERRVLATAFDVTSMEALQQAARLPGASSIETINGPGGGSKVTLLDPDGNMVELVHGIVKSEPLGVPMQSFNSAADRLRRRNLAVRPANRPSHVLRLGHVVLRTPDVVTLAQWYGETLGLLTSDHVHLPDNAGLLMSFLRLDHGADYVDHHVFQILHGEQNQFHHISFEVADIDDLHKGHAALAAGGYHHVWGVGRHLQGSQIFDYWLDPFGTMYEHWTDTDMFNAEVPRADWTIEQLHDSPWGPEMPAEFLHQGVF